MPVDDDTIAQWLSKADINAILAIFSTPQGSGEGNHLDLYVDVRLMQ